MVINIADFIAKGQYTSSLNYWSVRVIALCDRIAALEWALCCFCCFVVFSLVKSKKSGDIWWFNFKKLQLSQISSILSESFTDTTELRSVQLLLLNHEGYHEIVHNVSWEEASTINHGHRVSLLFLKPHNVVHGYCSREKKRCRIIRSNCLMIRGL